MDGNLQQNQATESLTRATDSDSVTETTASASGSGLKRRKLAGLIVLLIIGIGLADSRFFADDDDRTDAESAEFGDLEEIELLLADLPAATPAAASRNSRPADRTAADSAAAVADDSPPESRFSLSIPGGPGQASAAAADNGPRPLNSATAASSGTGSRTSESSVRIRLTGTIQPMH